MIHAKAGCLLAGVLKFLPLFMLVFPGMASRILYTDKVACVDPEMCNLYCNNKAGCTNIAYVQLVLHLLPTGQYCNDDNDDNNKNNINYNNNNNKIIIIVILIITKIVMIMIIIIKRT